MALALYRKYRSKKLSELVGQEHITTTLSNALKNGQISHAYLLTGPKGTGKTSIARILAHEINNLPYEDDAPHLDIIEIDAASNRGIEEIRDLRDKVRLAPSSAKYKVYIIDEVHMLTTQAFNALLKTLEEPPEHVVFILATTELHKLPETIVSRAQRYGFRPIGVEVMLPHLKMIAKKEAINIDDEAIRLIAKHSNGGFRDAISLLDQARSMDDHIGINTIEDMIGLPPKERVSNLISSVVAGDGRTALGELAELFDVGYQAGVVAAQLISEARDSLMSDSSDRHALIGLIEAVLDSQNSANHSIGLELAILIASGNADNEVKERPKTEKATEISSTRIQDIKPPEKQRESSKEESEIKPAPSKKASSAGSIKAWTDTLDAMKGSSNTLYGILRMAEASIEDDKLTLRFQFPFHMKRASEGKHSQIIIDTLKKQTGKTYEITFEKLTIEPAREKRSEKPHLKPEKASIHDDNVQNVLSVFGGGEVVN